jgi:hypothetical protein
MKIILPASLNPLSRRKDKSVKMSFETRELTSEETMSLLALEGSEGWLCFAPNEAEIEIPTGNVELGEKSPSERLRSVLFVWFKQETDAGRYVGLFDNFRKEKMESIINGVKSKLTDDR